MLTQVASSFLGDTTESTALEKLTGVKSTIGNIIHFTHGKRDEILSIATAKDVVSNVHHKSLKDSLETYECELIDRKSTRLNSSHVAISYAVFCLKKKIKIKNTIHK